MRRAAFFLSFWAMFSGSTGGFAETVTVEFVQPERYTDASPNGGFGLESERSALAEIRRYVEDLAARYLPADQVLAIDVLDVDLAGQFEPWPVAVNDVRILRDQYTPKIRMHYKLTEGARTLMEGEETVVDRNYLANPAARVLPDPLRYEKAMLSDWFQERLLTP